MSDSGNLIEIKVGEPEKIGDGMTAYVRYTVKTETNIPELNGNHFEVHRRFREFHAFYETLVDKYREKGIHIPHPPEKSVTTSARVKAATKDLQELTQIEIRRRALETFMNRIARHPVLIKEPIVIEFLTALVSTVKPRDNMIKLKMNIKSTFSLKFASSENFDKWYEEQLNHFNNLELTLQKFHYIALEIYSCRKDIINSYLRFSLCAAELRASEQNDSISAAVGAISDAKESLVQVQLELCNNDLEEFVGNTKDYLDDIISVQHLLEVYSDKHNEVTSLANKIDKLRERHANAQKNGQQSEIHSITTQMGEAEKLHSFASKNLDEFYEQMKKSIEYFENNRVKDTHESFIRYLKKSKECQEQMLTIWEKVLPICQDIK